MTGPEGATAVTQTQAVRGRGARRQLRGHLWLHERGPFGISAAGKGVGFLQDERPLRRSMGTGQRRNRRAEVGKALDEVFS